MPWKPYSTGSRRSRNRATPAAGAGDGSRRRAAGDVARHFVSRRKLAVAIYNRSRRCRHAGAPQPYYHDNFVGAILDEEAKLVAY
jgi:hypothetical protein